MRLLLVNSVAPDVWGGGEKWFVEAARWLGAHGHEVTVVGRPGARLLDAAGAAGVDTATFDFGGDYDPLASARAGWMLLRREPDLVLVNFNKEAWLFGRGCGLLGIPLLMRHGLTVLKPKFPHRVLVGGHVDRIVVNAAVIREEYRALGFRDVPIDVIENGVAEVDPAPPGTLRARLDLPADVPLVAAGGRMDGQKRLDRFVDVAARLAPAHPDAHFLLLGEGAQREALLSRIEAAGLRERFVVPGFVEDLARLIGDADLFLLTSRAEGTPNVLLETMAAGTACLSFDVGSVPQVLVGPLEREVVPEGDVEGMAARAHALLADPVERAATATAQRRRIHQDFSQDRSMERYVALFRALAPGAR